MNQPECDIWFGPGGLTGVFGAGVAAELQHAIQRGKLAASKLRLFGSSVGCLTAAYLATGNAADGIRVFHEDVQGLVTPANLLPSVCARLANRVVRSVWKTNRDFHVPSVLNVDHALDAMLRRTPNVISELLAAETPTFAECVEVRTGEFRHVKLQTAADPLNVIRRSLTCFPFAWSRQTDVVDAGIAGFGFTDLIHTGSRKLVVILNGDPTPRMGDQLAGIASAFLSAHTRVAQLYLLRQRNRLLALRSALLAGQRVLLIAPKRTVRVKLASDFQRAYEEGRQAALGVIDFAQA